jgi:hydrogenase maturation factor HypF (carbamoyltransferase family)
VWELADEWKAEYFEIQHLPNETTLSLSQHCNDISDIDTLHFVRDHKVEIEKLASHQFPVHIVDEFDAGQLWEVNRLELLKVRECFGMSTPIW